MKIKMFKIVILVLFICGCGYTKDLSLHDTIVVNNISEKSILVEGSLEYPDTTIHFNNPSLGNPHNIVSKNEINKVALKMKDTYERGIFAAGIDTIQIFIFDYILTNEISWEEIKNNYKVLYRYDLSLQDLQKLNWTIYYPPTEAMKDMKMYPPYKK